MCFVFLFKIDILYVYILLLNEKTIQSATQKITTKLTGKIKEIKTCTRFSKARAIGIRENEWWWWVTRGARVSGPTRKKILTRLAARCVRFVSIAILLQWLHTLYGSSTTPGSTRSHWSIALHGKRDSWSTLVKYVIYFVFKSHPFTSKMPFCRFHSGIVKSHRCPLTLPLLLITVLFLFRQFTIMFSRFRALYTFQPALPDALNHNVMSCPSKIYYYIIEFQKMYL